MSRETIDQIARRLAESLPQGMKSMRDDLEQNFRGILNAGLERLELVTREEFDVQEAVLARTRAKLESLEARLADIESGERAEKRTPGGKKKVKKSTAKKSAKKKSPGKASKKSKAGKKSASNKGKAGE